MPKISAGLLAFREAAHGREVLLVHPGGPLWARKDEASWSIPKGEVHEGEELLAAAKREFTEETGFLPEAPFIPLTPLRQPSGKVVHAWAVRGEFDAARLVSNKFTMEWPPGSGKMREFPEVDRAAWYSLDEAKRKIFKGQAGFLDQLEKAVVSD